MAPDTALIEDLRRFIRRIDRDIPITHAILFGSRARGDARQNSDVDLLRVSPAFEGRSAVARTLPLRRAWDLDYPVDFLCYGPGEFERLKDRVSIVRVALEEGVAIAA